MSVRTALKYGLAAAAGAFAATMLSEETWKQISAAADGVAKDVKAKAKRAGDVVAKVWREDVLGEKPKTTEPKEAK